MAKKTPMEMKDIEKKVQEFKIEILKQPQKKKSIKKEIARLLTMKNLSKLDGGSK